MPSLADAPDEVFESGHLWVRELVAGESLRVQVQDGGSLRFGSRRRTFRAGEAQPRFRHAVAAVRASLDVDALRAAVDDVESVVFFMVATQYDGVAYDWSRLPSVLGVDVWDGSRDAFLALDATERAFDRVGLPSANVLRKEVHVRDFDADAPSMPSSAWYDGPVAGVVLRTKTGDRVAAPNPSVDRSRRGDGSPPDNVTTPAEAAAATATEARFERVARAVTADGLPVSFDTLYDRVLGSIYREHHHWLGPETGEGTAVSPGPFRDAVAERTSRFLAER